MVKSKIETPHGSVMAEICVPRKTICDYEGGGGKVGKGNKNNHNHGDVKVSRSLSTISVATVCFPHVSKGWALIRGGPIAACRLSPPNCIERPPPEVITSSLANTLRKATGRITGNGGVRGWIKILDGCDGSGK